MKGLATFQNRALRVIAGNHCPQYIMLTLSTSDCVDYKSVEQIGLRYLSQASELMYKD